jgi:GTP-binding protein
VTAAIRNVAIIAHVDHGKTTLLDELLKQSGTIGGHRKIPERVMDSNDQERERGITILSKNTAIQWGDTRINIVDTPGHADFGGEVERVLRMVDSTLLLVDAAEGPMPQTRFVLRKSLALGHRPIVVINKIDRPDQRIDDVLNEVFDLFVALEATDEQLDFPVIYASGRNGYASLDSTTPGDTLSPMMDAIVTYVPPPDNSPDGPLQLQVTTLDYNEFLGRIAIGRVQRGIIRRGDRVVALRQDGTRTGFRVSRLMGFMGLERIDIESADAGDIVALAGIGDVTVGDTICDAEHLDALAPIPIDQPTVSMLFRVNTSPFCGTEGKYVTSRNIRERLERQLEHDVSLRVAPTESPDVFEVSGRGTLHLSVLIETMRRENFELAVSPPRVILREIDGVRCEPFEEIHIECADECSGAVIEKINQRGGDLQDMATTPEGFVRLRYIAPSRALIGYRSQFLTDTRGTGVLHSVFIHYAPQRTTRRVRANGVLIAQEKGETVAYSLHSLQERGALCCGPGEKVYAGQIIGLHSRSNDLVVNPSKKKQLTNMRSSGADDAIRLTPPHIYSLEEAMEFIQDDELVEVTPKSIRLRKLHLDHSERRRYEKDLV